MRNVYKQHNYVDNAVDNLSDHDPILLHLGLDLQYVGFAEKVHTPRASWKKASDLDLSNYRSALSRNLANLHFQTEVFTCHDMNCNNSHHFSVITDYVQEGQHTLTGQRAPPISGGT